MLHIAIKRSFYRNLQKQKKYSPTSRQMQVKSCEISPSTEAERNSPRILILPWRLSQRGTEYAVTMISGSEKLQKDNFTRFWTNLANFTTMHNEKRLLCEFKLRRDRPLSGKVKIPHLQLQYVSQGHVLCQSRWRAGVGAGRFRSSRRQNNRKENFG